MNIFLPILLYQFGPVSASSNDGNSSNSSNNVPRAPSLPISIEPTASSVNTDNFHFHPSDLHYCGEYFDDVEVRNSSEREQYSDPTLTILAYLRRDYITLAVDDLMCLPDGEYPDEFWEECINKLVESLDSTSFLQRVVVFNYLYNIPRTDPVSRLVTIMAVKALVKIAKSISVTCLSRGLRELLLLIPTQTWKACQQNDLFFLLTHAFTKLTTSAMFPGFVHIYMRHLLAIFEQLGPLYEAESSRVVECFIKVCPIVVNSAAHFMLFSALLDHVDIADELCRIVIQADVESVAGKELFERLLGKLVSKSKVNVRVYERKLNSSLTNNLLEQKEQDYIETQTVKVLVNALKTQVQSQFVCLDERDGAHVLSLLVGHLANCNLIPSECKSETVKFLERFDMVFPEKPAKSALEAFYLTCSGTESKLCNIDGEIIRILARIFDGLDQTIQYDYLSRFIDLYIANRRPELLYMLALTVPTTQIKPLDMAQLYTHFFTMTIKTPVTEDVTNLYLEITMPVLPHIPEPQYKQMLLKLARGPINPAIDEPLFNCILLIHCVIERPVQDVMFLKRLELHKVLDLKSPSKAYQEAMKAWPYEKLPWL